MTTKMTIEGSQGFQGLLFKALFSVLSFVGGSLFFYLAINAASSAEDFNGMVAFGALVFGVARIGRLAAASLIRFQFSIRLRIALCSAIASFLATATLLLLPLPIVEKLTLAGFFWGFGLAGTNIVTRTISQKIVSSTSYMTIYAFSWGLGTFATSISMHVDTSDSLLSGVALSLLAALLITSRFFSWEVPSARIETEKKYVITRFNDFVPRTTYCGAMITALIIVLTNSSLIPLLFEIFDKSTIMIGIICFSLGIPPLLMRKIQFSNSDLREIESNWRRSCIAALTILSIALFSSVDWVVVPAILVLSLMTNILLRFQVDISNFTSQPQKRIEVNSNFEIIAVISAFLVSALFYLFPNPVALATSATAAGLFFWLIFSMRRSHTYKFSRNEYSVREANNSDWHFIENQHLKNVNVETGQQIIPKNRQTFFTVNSAIVPIGNDQFIHYFIIENKAKSRVGLIANLRDMLAKEERVGMIIDSNNQSRGLGTDILREFSAWRRKTGWPILGLVAQSNLPCITATKNAGGVEKGTRILNRIAGLDEQLGIGFIGMKNL